MFVSTQRTALLAALGLGLACPLAGQRIVSPVGDVDPALPGLQALAIYEGNMRDVNLFGRDPALPPDKHSGESRWEQVDGELTGALYKDKILKRITFRRDGFFKTDDLRAFPRVIWIHLRVGPGTYNDFGKEFGKNFAPVPSWDPRYPKSVVGTSVDYRAFNLPDLRSAPPTTPAPWFVPIPFDTPYRIPLNADVQYDSFVWSMQVAGVVTGCYPLDVHEAVVVQNFSSQLGVGCVVRGNSQPMFLRLVGDMDPSKPSYTLNFDLDNGPKLQPVFMVAGTLQQNTPIAGFCTNFYVRPMAFFGIGSTNAAGFLASKLTTPWLDYYEAQHLVFQALVPDPDNLYPIKFAGSNGLDHRICESTPKVKSLFSHLRHATTGDLRFGRGVVTGFVLE